MRTYYSILAFIALSSIFILLCNKSPDRAEIKGISLIITPSKVNYLEGEKVWLKIVLVNNSGKEYPHKEFYLMPHHMILKGIDPLNRELSYSGVVPFYIDTTYILQNGDSLIHYSRASDSYRMGKQGNYTFRAVFQNVESNTLSINYVEPIGEDKEVFSRMIKASHERSTYDLEKLLEQNPNSKYGPEISTRLLLRSFSDTLKTDKIVTNFFKRFADSYEAIYILGNYNSYLKNIKNLSEEKALDILKTIALNYKNTFTSNYIFEEYLRK